MAARLFILQQNNSLDATALQIEKGTKVNAVSNVLYFSFSSLQYVRYIHCTLYTLSLPSVLL